MDESDSLAASKMAVSELAGKMETMTPPTSPQRDSMSRSRRPCAAHTISLITKGISIANRDTSEPVNRFCRKLVHMLKFTRLTSI